MPKIILIQPTQYGSATGKPCKQRRIYLPGLALPLLAAYVPSHWEVKIVIEVVENIDYDEDVDLVGIGAMGHAVFRAMDIAKEYKKRGKTVFMGGYMASLMPEFVKGHCDSVVIGDGEISLPMLIDDFEKTGTVKPVYDYQLKDLEGLLMPRYDMLIKKKIGLMLPVQAGRGCPHTCTYCSIACIYKGRYLVRPVDEVMKDIYKVKELGYNRFFLIDDNIAGNPEFLSELAKRIKPLKMTWASQCTILIAKNEKLLRAVAESGCKILSLGIESISQEGLNLLNKEWVKTNETAELLKKIQSYGILPATEMVVGTDGDTKESIRQTADFIIKCKIPVPKFYVLTPLPGTEFYKQIKQQGRLLHENYEEYTATKSVFKPLNLSPEELDNEFWKLYTKTYSYKNVFKRTIFNRGFLKSPLIYLFAFFTNLVYKKYLRQGDSPNIL